MKLQVETDKSSGVTFFAIEVVEPVRVWLSSAQNDKPLHIMLRLRCQQRCLSAFAMSVHVS